MSAHNTTRTVNVICGKDVILEAIRWIWPRWLAKGKLSLLAGVAGTGKTTLAISLGAIVSKGQKWPDGASNEGVGNVLMWSGEDSIEDTLAVRMVAAGADMSRCFFVGNVFDNGRTVSFDPSRDLHDLHLKVEQMGGVDLVLIDPIVSAVSGDMHRANDVRRSLQPLVDFARVHNCAVLGITHFSKDGLGKSPMDRVIGSQAFSAFARTVLVAARNEKTNRRAVALGKSNISADGGGIIYAQEEVVVAGSIKASRTVWGKVLEGAARDILSDIEGIQASSGDEHADLKQLLIDLLTRAGGTMQSTQLEAEVRSAGYSWHSAKRVKGTVGIVAKKDGMNGPWVWQFSGTV